MPDSERMTIDERRKCLKRMQRRYLAADRGERGRLLADVGEELTGLHCKRLVRLRWAPDLAQRPRARRRARSTGSRWTTRCG